jgi:hypothetical protein
VLCSSGIRTLFVVVCDPRIRTSGSIATDPLNYKVVILIFSVFESRDQAVDYVPLEALHAPATPTPGTMDEYSASLHAQSYLTSRDVEVDDNLPAQQLSQANSDMMPFTNDGRCCRSHADLDVLPLPGADKSQARRSRPLRTVRVACSASMAHSFRTLFPAP